MFNAVASVEFFSPKHAALDPNTNIIATIIFFIVKNLALKKMFSEGAETAAD